MDITTKKGKQGRKDIDRITVEKGRRGDFSPLQPDHYHSFYEIFYLWSGSCRFLLKDTVYQMEAGDLVFIAPGELHHSLYSAGEVCEIVMIYFKEEYLHLSDRSADSLTSISGQGLQLHSFMGSIPTVYQEYLRSLLTRMLTENSRFDQYSEHFERCYLEELLLMLMRHSVMNEKEPDLLNSPSYPCNFSDALDALGHMANKQETVFLTGCLYSTEIINSFVVAACQTQP